MASNDDLLLRCARNCGGAYVAWARAASRPTLVADDLLLADFGSPVPVSANHASVLTPTSEADVEDLVGRLGAFFTGPGGGYQLWSVWPMPDLSSFGFERSTSPCMVMDLPHADARGVPPGLRIDRAQSADALAEAGRLVGEVFGAEMDGAAIMPAGMLDDPDIAVWLGWADGTPVTTAMTYVSAGFAGVYVVATIPAARGRGFGEAITREAVGWRPDLPATLQASEMGRPVYERIGFRTVADFTIWKRPSRHS